MSSTNGIQKENYYLFSGLGSNLTSPNSAVYGMHYSIEKGIVGELFIIIITNYENKWTFQRFSLFKICNTKQNLFLKSRLGTAQFCTNT